MCGICWWCSMRGDGDYMQAIEITRFYLEELVEAGMEYAGYAHDLGDDALRNACMRGCLYLAVYAQHHEGVMLDIPVINELGVLLQALEINGLPELPDTGVEAS